MALPHGFNEVIGIVIGLIVIIVGLIFNDIEVRRKMKPVLPIWLTPRMIPLQGVVVDEPLSI